MQSVAFMYKGIYRNAISMQASYVSSMVLVTSVLSIAANGVRRLASRARLLSV